MGGRAESGLQGEYEQVGSVPDQLGGLRLSARNQANQGVCMYVPALFVVGTTGSRERERSNAVPRRDLRSWSAEREDSPALC